MTYQFPIDLQISKTKERSNVRIFKRNEPKTFTPPRLSIQHDSRIDDLAKLRKEFAHGLGGDAAWQASNEELGGALVLLTGDGTFRVDLREREHRSVPVPSVKKKERKKKEMVDRRCTHDFAVQDMLSDHNGIYTRRVFKGQESKTPRPSRCITHNGAGIDFSEL